MTAHSTHTTTDLLGFVAVCTCGWRSLVTKNRAHARRAGAAHCQWAVRAESRRR